MARWRLVDIDSRSPHGCVDGPRATEVIVSNGPRYRKPTPDVSEGTESLRRLREDLVRLKQDLWREAVEKMKKGQDDDDRSDDR